MPSVVLATRAFAQPSSDLREQFRQRSEAAERTGLAEPFTGMTTDGHVVPGLFPVQSTGVSTAPVRQAAEQFLAALTAEQRVVSLLLADNYSSPVPSPRIGSISPSSARKSGSQSLVKPGSAVSEHTWPASSHDHDPRQPLTTLETAAMAARETLTPHAGSTRGPSALLSSPVCRVATVWRSPFHWWAQVAATADVSWHAVTRSCGRPGTAPTAGVYRPRPCTAW